MNASPPPGTPSADAQEEYARRIQERFLQWRRTTLTLSPADWQLIDDWWTRGIPLWIVLESVDAVFERKDRAGDASPARRLSSCKREVESRFSALGRARIESGPVESRPADLREDLIARLEQRAGGLRDEESGPVAALLEETVRAVRRLPGSLDPVSLQLRLLEIEEELLRSLRAATPDGPLARLRSEVELSLGEHAERMTPDAFESTVNRLLDERLRDLYRIPSLLES